MWPDWVIFEIVWWQIFIQKLPKIFANLWAILKHKFFSFKTDVATFWTPSGKIGLRFILTSGHTGPTCGLCLEAFKFSARYSFQLGLLSFATTKISKVIKCEEAHLGLLRLVRVCITCNKEIQSRLTSPTLFLLSFMTNTLTWTYTMTCQKKHTVCFNFLVIWSFYLKV